MSTHGSFNSKNPTIKRILKEAAELSQSPSRDYTAAPLDANLFEWHFTLRGPPAPSPFAGGLYHGRIVLPPQYPLRPPSFRFLTPSGRFEANREICLSISGHHEESWQPAWGIRTALVAIRSFMDSDAKGQLGGLDAAAPVRVRLARESRDWACPSCLPRRANYALMAECEQRARELELDGADGRAVPGADVVPPELTLGYRDEMDAARAAAKGKQRELPGAPGAAPGTVLDAALTTAPEEAPPSDGAAPLPLAAPPAPQPQPPAQTVQVPVSPSTPVRQQHRARPRTAAAPQPTRSSNLVDMAIVGIAVALGIMVIRKVLAIV